MRGVVSGEVLFDILSLRAASISRQWVGLAKRLSLMFQEVWVGLGIRAEREVSTVL